MANLPNGINGSDANGGSIFMSDTRIVWEIAASMNLPEVASVHGTGEVKRTGRYVFEKRVYHFLAPPDEAAARLAWATRMKYGPEIVGEPTFTPLCKIDGEIKLGNH